MIWAPVAQLDRASASGVEGRGFESRRVYQFFLQNKHKKSPQKSENSRLQARLALEFFIFAWCQLLTTDVIFLRVAFAALRLAAGLRPCVESRRVYQFFCKINTKNHRKNQKTQDCKQDLLLSFLFLLGVSCLQLT